MSKVSGLFEVYSKGNVMSGYVTFWKSGKHYYRQSIGLTGAIRCSKKLYDEAKALYEEQQRERCE